MATRCISLVNFKGGVGKTSLVVNLAACLAYDLGRRVLVVDCDPQSNASIWLMGLDRFTSSYDPKKSTYGVLMNRGVFSPKIIQKSVVRVNDEVAIPSLDLLPSCYEMMDFEHEFSPKEGLLPIYGLFHQAMKSISGSYDFVLFDCPPNVYRSSKAGIFAAQEIFVPCNPDALSNMGLALLRKKLSAFYHETMPLRKNMRRPNFPKIRGVLLNKVPHADVEADVQKISLKIKSFREHRNIATSDADIWPVHIRQAIAGSRVVGDHVPLIVSGERSPLLDDYINLARLIDASPMT